MEAAGHRQSAAGSVHEVVQPDITRVPLASADHELAMGLTKNAARNVQHPAPGHCGHNREDSGGIAHPGGSPLELQDMATMDPAFYQGKVLYILEGHYNTVHRNHIT